MLISDALTKINVNSTKINKLLKTVSDEVSEFSAALSRLQKANTQKRIAELQKENNDLEKQVEKYKETLFHLRTTNDVDSSQSSTSIKESSIVCTNKTSPAFTEKHEARVTAPAKGVQSAAPAGGSPKEAKPGTSKKENKKAAAPAEQEEDIHFGRLDMRVGKIISVDKHPNADSLYVEQVDIGDEKPRTVLSGLVKFVPIEEMKDRVAVFLCNLKPAKMRGISSEGMIMCANDGDKCEILEPPAGCIPGMVVTVEGYERKPDPQLNPKKKIFETVQVDLKTNDKKMATYKGIPWNVGGKGPAVSKSLTNTNIK